MNDLGNVIVIFFRLGVTSNRQGERTRTFWDIDDHITQVIQVIRSKLTFISGMNLVLSLNQVVI